MSPKTWCDCLRVGRRPEEKRAEVQDSTTNDLVSSFRVERLLMEARAWKAHLDYWLCDPW